MAKSGNYASRGKVVVLLNKEKGPVTFKYIQAKTGLSKASVQSAIKNLNKYRCLEEEKQGGLTLYGLKHDVKICLMMGKGWDFDLYGMMCINNKRTL